MDYKQMETLLTHIKSLADSSTVIINQQMRLIAHMERQGEALAKLQIKMAALEGLAGIGDLG